MTAAHGAVLYTASGAVLRGFNVIVPLDCVSAQNTYIEQYVAYHSQALDHLSQSYSHEQRYGEVLGVGRYRLENLV